MVDCVVACLAVTVLRVQAGVVSRQAQMVLAFGFFARASSERSCACSDDLALGDNVAACFAGAGFAVVFGTGALAFFFVVTCGFALDFFATNSSASGPSPSSRRFAPGVLVLPVSESVVVDVLSVSDDDVELPESVEVDVRLALLLPQSSTVTVEAYLVTVVVLTAGVGELSRRQH